MQKSKVFSIDIHNPHSKRTMNSKRKSSSMKKNDAFIICEESMVHEQFYSSSHLTQFIVRHPNATVSLFLLCLSLR